MMPHWLSCSEYAELAGVPDRTARYRLSEAGKMGGVGRTGLQVRATKGAGGNSGVRYEVALSSLPEALQRAFEGGTTLPAPIEPVRLVRAAPLPAANQGETIKHRWQVIRAALAHPYRSRERKSEIERAHREWRVPIKTIYNWISALEAAGGDVNALANKRPSNAGQRRVVVSRKFDRAFLDAGGDPDLLPEIDERCTQLTRAAWASPVQRSGWKAVRKEVMTALARDIWEKGLGRMELRPDMLSQRRIMEYQNFRLVDIRTHDRKRFDDNKPRSHRRWSDLRPMEVVICDVKPIDCIVTRPDGSTAWPKLIGFMDGATHRLFFTIVLLRKGEGVRQEHVTETFIRMVMHPEWGLPEHIYRDNGMEFAHLDKVSEALVALRDFDRGRYPIINARPYQGAAKPVEMAFARLDRFVFSPMKGYAGSNRMNKKTETVGKPPEPYPGSFDEFVQEVRERIADVEHDPFGSGEFKGRSPQGIFADHVANKWQPYMADPIAIDAAFSKRDTRVVRRGEVSIGDIYYRHPELPNGQTVTIALPWRRGAMPLVELPGFGWAMLEPVQYYHPLDITGAKAAGRMQQANERRISQMKREAGVIDLEANRKSRLVNLPRREMPHPIRGVLASPEAAEMAAAREAGEAKIIALPDEAERRRMALEEEAEMLEKALARK